MALLILAGLQMIPSDIYEAAKIDGVHPVKVFLTRHAAAGAAGADGGGDLPPARRAAHLRPDLRADAQQRADQDDVGHRAREPHRFRQVRLRLGAVDAAVPDHRAHHRALHLARPGQSRGGHADAADSSSRTTALLPRWSSVIVVDRGLSVLLRDPHQLQDPAPRSSRSTTGRPSSRFDNYVRRVHDGQLPAQHPELVCRRVARRWPLVAAARRSPPPTRSPACTSAAATLLLLTILVGLDVSADRRAGRPVRADPLRSASSTRRSR